MTVIVVPPSHPLARRGIDTTSHSTGWGRGLSPFLLGPVAAGDGAVARNVENLWQYTKVYEQHVGEDGHPSAAWWAWRAAGFAQERAVRYPMGKGARPSYAWWGRRMGYVEARRVVYVPAYACAVVATEAFGQLAALYARDRTLVLVDFDSYDHRRIGWGWKEVFDCRTKSAGHGFVLAMLLEGIISPPDFRTP